MRLPAGQDCGHAKQDIPNPGAAAELQRRFFGRGEQAPLVVAVFLREVVKLHGRRLVFLCGADEYLQTFKSLPGWRADSFFMVKDFPCLHQHQFFAADGGTETC